MFPAIANSRATVRAEASEETSRPRCRSLTRTLLSFSVPPTSDPERAASVRASTNALLLASLAFSMRSSNLMGARKARARTAGRRWIFKMQEDLAQTHAPRPGQFPLMSTQTRPSLPTSLNRCWGDSFLRQAMQVLWGLEFMFPKTYPLKDFQKRRRRYPCEVSRNMLARLETFTLDSVEYLRPVPPSRSAALPVQALPGQSRLRPSLLQPPAGRQQWLLRPEVPQGPRRP